MAKLTPSQKAALHKARQLANSMPAATHDEIVYDIFDTAKNIAQKSVRKAPGLQRGWQEALDRMLTSPLLGFPAMLVLLALVFWLSIVGAEYPSQWLFTLFNAGERLLIKSSLMVGLPTWLHGFCIQGIYRSTGWVIAVMLPPMAIFFPLFTLLEDLGYLPRIAFNLDHLFRKVGGHGKQALTMCMGFGCNAAGVIACRIIASPRERLVAILTNTFAPCNGRFPTFFALAAIFLSGAQPGFQSSLLASICVATLVLIGVATTFLMTRLLTYTILKGVPSAFVLELPPYRPPQIKSIVIRSIFDRTIQVLFRALVWAAPAGALTWILANSYWGPSSLLALAAAQLDNTAKLLGLDGTILLAFCLGLPANEIVLPTAVMGYLSEGALIWPESLIELRRLLLANGWTAKTAILVMLFSLLHFPCSTTLWTILKETGSRLWTAVAFLMPLTLACFVLYTLNLLLP
ncbi:MAG TPA: nucleoside recognition domain-containing protein [bacterium]|nr:nucleoside recognition domain-containing protein [bacterium]